MLDLFSTDQQDALSPNAGQIARQAQPSFGEAYQAASEANTRYGGLFAETANQNDYLQQRLDAFHEATGTRVDNPYGLDDGNRAARFQATRDRMAKVIADEGFDPSYNFPSDDEIAKGGLGLARRALQRQAEIGAGATSLGTVLGSTAAGAKDSATDPLNLIALAAAPEGGMLLASALRVGGAMGAQTLAGDALKFGYRQQANPDYGVGDVLKDAAGAAAGGALFGVGHAVGGEGIKAALGAAAGGALGGAALGGISGGAAGAVEGAVGGAAIPLAGAGFGLSAKTLGMGWRVLRETRPDAAAAMPLEVRDAGAVAEKAGDVQAQNPFRGPAGEAAHSEAVGKIEADVAAGRPPELPQAAANEAAARRGQVFYPGGAIDARYTLAEHADLVTSHDADFAVNPAYPAELQPRDRGGAPARDQVNNIAANLAPDRLGPSPEANSGAPIVGPDGVVESGNGRALAIGQAYDQGGGAAAGYRQWLEQHGYDTSGYDRPVLVGVRETPFDAGQRADFAHAANGSAALRMSATEQAMSDARLLDGSILDFIKSSEFGAMKNGDAVRAFVGKLPAGERGTMLQQGGSISATGLRRMQAALAARAYGDPGVLARMLDHPDPNIKAIAGALTDAAGPWARMRDAATRGDIAGGHDITGDMLQAVRAIMRARDEGRPAWEVLNQGDIFQSDTTQMATRLFFRDEEDLRVKLMSAIYDERQFAYLAGGSTRVKAVAASAKAGTLPGELARSVFLFKSFPMSMLATWGMRSAREIGQGRIGTAATLVTGMTMAGALAIQARSVLSGKDPRSMKDPFFWGESFLQGGAAGIYGDFFKEAFSRSDTSLTESLMGPLATIPASIQSLTSGARRAAEDGQNVNFGAKLSRIISQNVPGSNLWYGRLLASRLLFDNIQKLLDRDYAKSFARQQQRSIKTNHQGFFWAPGQSAPGR